MNAAVGRSSITYKLSSLKRCVRRLIEPAAQSKPFVASLGLLSYNVQEQPYVNCSASSPCSSPVEVLFFLSGYLPPAAGSAILGYLSHYYCKCISLLCPSIVNETVLIILRLHRSTLLLRGRKQRMRYAFRDGRGHISIMLTFAEILMYYVCV